jgi:hypothetical protein
MKRGESIETILNRCLADLEAGEDVAACLSDVPQHAAELEPLLTVAASLRRWQPPTLTARARATARERALSALAAQHQSRTVRRPLLVSQLGMRFAMILVLMLMILGGGVTFAQTSLPGQLLYSLKRGSEQVRLDLASNAEQGGLYLDFSDRRLNEALALLNADQSLDPELLRALALDYDMAWQSIMQAEPAQRPVLIARYRDAIMEHQQLIAAALARTTTTTARSAMGQIGRINRDAATYFATPTPVPLPATPAPTPSRTPRPTATATPSPYPTSPPAPTVAPPAPTALPPALPTPTPRPRIAQPTAIPIPTHEVEPVASPAPTDDHGGDHSGPSPTDDHSGPSPTDDHSGPNPTDDHGGDHSGPSPTDDHSGPSPTDDHSGDHSGPSPTDDHGGSGHGGSGGSGTDTSSH